jgi:hypothetical protein
LYGVSGGAVWQLPADSRDVPLLAGIIVTWRKSEPEGIIATRARVLRDFLASRYT